MAVQDLWVGRDGRPTDRHGRGRRYRVVVPGHASRSFATKKPAEMYEAKLLVEGPVRPADRETTVGDLVSLWVKSKAHLSRKGLEGVRLSASAVRGHWGDTLAADVTSSSAQAWITAEPGSPSRKHKLAQCLAGALAIGVRRGVIEVNPAEKLQLPRERPREPVYLTDTQVAAIASHAHGHTMARAPGSELRGWYAPMVWLMATSAARIGEVCAMDVGDVTRRRVGGRLVWRARVRESKSGVARDLPISAGVVGLLDLSRPASEPLIVTPLGHRVLKDNWRARVWTRALESAGLAGQVTPHDLRHTAISWAIADGADVKAVQRMAGHRSAALTLDVYGHLWDEGLDRVADGMERRLRA